jgi:hypothetical protein
MKRRRIKFARLLSWTEFAKIIRTAANSIAAFDYHRAILAVVE